MQEQKLFPLRLPPNYHGQQKPFRRLSEAYRQKSFERQPEDPEVPSRVSNWQLKRFDKDVIRERRQFLVHPAKTSQDSPEWFKTTLHHFHRTNYVPHPRINRADQLKFTVFNQRRTDPFLVDGQLDLQRSMRIKKQQPVTEKVGMRDSSYSGRWATQREVTGKIGSVEIRNYSVPQPLLKIGQSNPHNFVNTYQIA